MLREKDISIHDEKPLSHLDEQIFCKYNNRVSFKKRQWNLFRYPGVDTAFQRG